MPHRKPLSLSRAFNDAATHPALRFQRQNNLRGIAGRYFIPDGKTAAQYEKWMSRRMSAHVGREMKKRNATEFDYWAVAEDLGLPPFLEKSWDRLVELNPALKDVKLNKSGVEDVYNAHIGVTSGFNVDDINFFLKQKHIGDGLPAKQAREMPVHGARLARIRAAAEAEMFWVVSPATAKKIEKRFKRNGRL
ncbi:MAG: hypothetical protein ACAH83_07370 [Alphaproteobacteria bacterium]